MFQQGERVILYLDDNKGQAHQNSKVIDWGGGVEEPCKGDTPA